MLRCLMLFSSAAASSSWLIALPSMTLAIMRTYGRRCESSKVTSSRSRPSSANVTLSHDGRGISWDACCFADSALSEFALKDSVAPGTDAASRSHEEEPDVGDCRGMSDGDPFHA